MNDAAYSDADMTRSVAVVAHTHWDREWYAPYEHFRARLTSVLDEVLSLLESDPSYRYFLLDGQMAMIDDYLEVRPEAAGRVRRLAEQGRLALAWDAAECFVPDEAGRPTALTRVYLGADGVMAPMVTQAEKDKRRAQLKAKRRRRGRKWPSASVENPKYGASRPSRCAG